MPRSDRIAIVALLVAGALGLAQILVPLMPPADIPGWLRPALTAGILICVLIAFGAFFYSEENAARLRKFRATHKWRLRKPWERAESGASQVAGDVVSNISASKQPTVRIELPATWEPPFRLRRLSEYGAHQEKFAEEICLRLTACSNLKNVSVRIMLKQHSNTIKSIRLKGNEFSGDIPKGLSEDIIVYSNVFELVNAVWTNQSDPGQKETLRSRMELEVFLPIYRSG